MPELPSPKTRKKKESKGGVNPFPYSGIYLMGLKLGFTTEDLRTMPYTRLVMFIDEYAWQNEPEDDGKNDGVREATQADINRYLG